MPRYTIWVPVDMIEAYNVTRRDATGQTIAIVLFGLPVPQADLTRFAHLTNTPVLTYGKSGPDTVHFNLVGGKGTPIQRSRMTYEEAMDVEYAHAMAWGSHLEVYLGLGNAKTGGIDDNGIAAALTAAEHFDAQIISLSVAGQSLATYPRGQFPPSVRQEIAAMAYGRAHGKTLFVASGDHGSLSGCVGQTDKSTCPPLPPMPSESGSSPASARGLMPVSRTQPVMAAPTTPQPSFPAESPDVIAVGGTTLYRNGDWNYYEKAWGGDLGNMSSGGGCSLTYPRPAWQTNVPTVPCVATHGQAVPDVAAVADWIPGPIVVPGGTMGGTSLAAPVWAGIAADLAYYLQTQDAPPTGFMAPGLYRLASNPQMYARDFHDITEYGRLSTTNGFPVGAGWDAATGLGSPNLANLEQDWATTDGGLTLVSSSIKTPPSATPTPGVT